MIVMTGLTSAYRRPFTKKYGVPLSSPPSEQNIVEIWARFQAESN